MVRPAAASAWYGTRAAAQSQGPRVPFSGVLTPTPQLFSVHHQDWRWRADSDALSLSPRCLSRPHPHDLRQASEKAAVPTGLPRLPLSLNWVSGWARS